MTATALHRCWSPAMFQPSGRPCLATARSRVSRRGADNTSKTTPFSLGLPSSREGCSPQTTRPSAGLRLGCLAALGCLLLAGCASVKMPAGLRGEFSRKQQQREQQAIHQFEQHRDLAEYQAAVHARNPRHTAARLLLADVYLAQERYADALEQAQRVLAHSPKNAEAHYMMGLVLDARGDFADALEHYRRAVEIEPEEEIYRLGYALARVQTSLAWRTRRPRVQPRLRSREQAVRCCTVCLRHLMSRLSRCKRNRSTTPTASGRPVAQIVRT